MARHNPDLPEDRKELARRIRSICREMGFKWLKRDQHIKPERYTLERGNFRICVQSCIKDNEVTKEGRLLVYAYKVNPVGGGIGGEGWKSFHQGTRTSTRVNKSGTHDAIGKRLVTCINRVIAWCDEQPA